MAGRRSIRVRAGAAAVAALLTGAVTGCQPEEAGRSDGKGAATGGPPAVQDVDWRACEAPEGGERPSKAWRCADVDVPVDYADPDGETMSIALIRKEATDKKDRIGSLLFNFGGPGASGVAVLPGYETEYAGLNARYDLVGFDPRGVGGSSGVKCRGDKEQEKALAGVDSTPDTAAEEAAYLQDARSFGAGCARAAGDLLPHLTTSNTARDMDVVRQVLGDDKLHYLGFSYGTQLGAVYAHLFPKNTGRLVLDAVVDPTADTAAHARHQTTGFQRALNNYFEKQGEDPEEGTARVAALLERLDEQPLPTGDGRELTQSLGVTGIIYPLYSEDMWPYLTQGLDDAESGDGSMLLALADGYNERGEDGRYGTTTHAQRAISCADSSERPTLDEARTLVEDLAEVSPVFGPALAWDTAGWCADWPAKGERATVEVSAPGAAPILVVGTTGDSATPYEGARVMAEELGEGVGVLVTNEGEGHGAYGSASCATRVVDDYLLRGKVPSNGTTCKG
ncbi:alpha/beta hydrolase [Streptomyces sp. CC77]|uniref:alpha/beta hydrolase n=1 Tax=Streptomyces sp. CC77 TaxID=1906739 RepID=UPI0008DE9B43|nr:alpha/beta hydrolase [Streptomyces sp. CC77]OII67794.1 peptidase [Streptomyces sp. CC77]